VIQHRIEGPRLYRRLRRALASQELFKEARERCNSCFEINSDIQPDRAHDYFFTSWTGMNGLAGTKRYNLGFARRLTKSGGSPGKRLPSAVDSIPAFRRRLRNLTVLKTDGIQLAENIEDATGTVIYADPPYIVEGGRYQHGFTEEDHLRLAAALGRFRKTRIIVSYYEHPLLSDLYPGWTKTTHVRRRSLASQGWRGKENNAEAPEVLLINGPSLVAAQSSVALDLF
jgi:DNA adenine methylase